MKFNSDLNGLKLELLNHNDESPKKNKRCHRMVHSKILYFVSHKHMKDSVDVNNFIPQIPQHEHIVQLS